MEVSDAYMIGGQKLPKALEDSTKTSLSHSESINTGKLKKPVIRPIVEEINDEIHVIDCLGSHEVLDSDSGCWEEVPIPTDEK